MGSRKPRVVLLGHIVLDNIAMRHEPSWWTIGGGVIYGAHTASLIGLRVAIVSVVGSDFPAAALAKLSREGIELRVVRSEGKTTRFLLRYPRSGARQLVLSSQAPPLGNRQLGLSRDSVLVACPVFHEMSRSALIDAANRAGELHLDPQGFCRETDSEGRVMPRRWKPPPAVGNLRTLKFSLEELPSFRSSSSEGRESTLARISKELRCDAILTLGSQGLLAHGSSGSRIRMPAFKARPERYPTGAGDVLLGAYVAKRLGELGFVESLAYASAVASVHVESNLLNLDTLNQETVEERAGWILERTEVRD